MSRIVRLENSEALDPTLVGFKAARLAAASRAGVPVVTSLVIPAAAGERCIARGEAAIAGGNPQSARRAVMGCRVSKTILDEVRRGVSTWTAPTVVVRSSSHLEASGAWAGAFASYLGVAPGEIETAILGCWASVFSPDAVGRLTNLGLTVRDVGMAVLIQPYLDASAGGWARVSGSQVELVAVAGHPAPLFGGYTNGHAMLVDRHADRSAPFGELPVGAQAIATLVRVVTLAHETVGYGELEWVAQGERIFVTQLNRTDERTPAADAVRPRTRAARASTDCDATPMPGGARPFASPAYRRIARHLVGRRGPLADRLIAPWCAAVSSDTVNFDPDGPPAVLFAEAERLAARLTKAVSTATTVPADAIFDRLRMGDAEFAERIGSVDLSHSEAQRVLGILGFLAHHMVRTGSLSSPHEFWRQPIAWVRASLAGRTERPRAAGRIGHLWSEILYRTTVDNGVRLEGVPAAPGSAVGRARPSGPHDRGTLEDEVLFVANPLPALAPYLWSCRAIVTAGGSPAAHLFDVARALRVPAVSGAPIALLTPGSLAAVDGSTGEVWIWAMGGG